MSDTPDAQIADTDRMDEWIPYDPDHKTANPLPEVEGDGLARWSRPVWVHDAFYHGVMLACWTQNGDDPTRGWWVGLGPDKDDIGVTHWHPMAQPDPPRIDGGACA